MGEDNAVLLPRQRPTGLACQWCQVPWQAALADTVGGCLDPMQQTPRPPSQGFLRLLTFHEHPDDIAEDGQGGAQHEDGEEEGADRIRNLVLGLQRAGGKQVLAAGGFGQSQPREPTPTPPTVALLALTLK